ncbi:hypothetical protein BDV98DRAFT_561735 [Pterulicium gracile]|uniref:Uncharacterized protein n=1 Tax=Pterulicium gracile TaxID=1884261 RepID=A0A5C3QTD2_9AGAR|nr:hypothetical protein BDV98DRAFT_561735 [Pterula gracilis]
MLTGHSMQMDHLTKSQELSEVLPPTTTSSATSRIHDASRRLDARLRQHKIPVLRYLVTPVRTWRLVNSPTQEGQSFPQYPTTGVIE